MLPQASIGEYRCKEGYCDSPGTGVGMMSEGSQLRRIGRLAQYTVTGALLVAAVLFSPFALGWISHRNVDWGKLGNVGQAYQAVAAVLTALALLFVAQQVRLQRQELRANRIEEHRRRHQEIRLLMMADPVYMACWGTFDMGSAGTFEEKRQFQYLNLLFLSWLTSQRVGLPLWDLEVVLAGIFEGKPGRDYWTRMRPVWVETYTSQQERKLIALVDASFAAAVAVGEPMSNTELLGRMSQEETSAVSEAQPHDRREPLSWMSRTLMRSRVAVASLWSGDTASRSGARPSP